MNKQHTLIFLLITLLVGVVGPASLTLPAHGATNQGVVCISPSLTSCPQISFTFNATNGSPRDIYVNYNGPVSAPQFNTFDISVFVPTGDLNIPSPGSSSVTIGSGVSWIVAQECIEGTVVTAACSPTDGSGVVHVVAGCCLGGGGTNANQTLFIIHYTVAGTTTGVGVLFLNGQSGAPDGACSATSAPDGTTCVTLVNPTTANPDPENIENADFTNLTPAANFFANPLSGLAPLTVTFDASQSKPTTSTTNTIIKYNWAFGDGQVANVTSPTTTHTYSSRGSFTPTLYVLDSGQKKSEIKSGAIIQALIPDFGISATPSSFTGPQSLVIGKPEKNSTIALTSLSQFSGTVALSVKLNTTVSNAPTAILTLTSVNLKAGGTNSSTVLILKAAAATPVGGYSANITATSGSLVHFVVVNFAVLRPDFSFSSIIGFTVTIPQGGNSQASLAVNSLNTFNGTVTLSTRENTIGLLATATPSSVTVHTVTIPSVSFTLAIGVLSGTLPGNYLVTVIGNWTGGTLSHNVNVTVIVPSPNFAVTASPGSFSIQAGATSNATIILNGINGYSTTSSPITLTSNSSSTLGITTTPSPGSVSITTPGGFATLTLTVATTSSTPAGSYAISVKASDGTNSHNYNITLAVTAPLASVQVGAIILSTTRTTLGNTVTMNVTVTSTRASSVSLTVYMQVYSGTGNNLTVDSKAVTLTSTQPKVFTLTWDTSRYTTGTYHVYVGIIGNQTSSINQSASAGSVSLNAQSQTNTLASLAPWIATAAEAAVIALLVALLTLRRRRTSTA